MKREVSDATREKLRQQAVERHQNGGFKSKPGTTRRKKPSRQRIAQLVAEAALEKKTAKQIIDVFKDGIHKSQPMNIRLKAAEAWIGVERSEATLTLKEDVSEQEAYDREKALEFLSKRLTQSHAAHLLRQRLELEQQTGEPVIEGEAWDEDED